MGSRMTRLAACVGVGARRLLDTGCRAPTSFVGLDIGSSAIRLIELRRRRRMLDVGAHGAAPRPRPPDARTDAAEGDEVAARLAPLAARLALSTRRVAIGLGGSDTFITRFTLPRLPRRELAAAVRWEARAHVPFAVDEVALDYDVVADRTGAPEVAVVLAATRRRTVERWQSLVARAGLELARIDVLPFALHRVCVWLGTLSADAADPVLVLHIGARESVACLARGGDALFVRDLGMGGDAWSAALAREVGCSLDEAETLKCASAAEPAGCGLPAAAPARALALATDAFATELARTVAFACQHDAAPPPVRVVLSGGGACLPGLAAAVGARLGCPAAACDLARMPASLAADAPLPALGPAWTVALGVALGGVWR